MPPQVSQRWGGQKIVFASSARELVPPTLKLVAPPLLVEVQFSESEGQKQPSSKQRNSSSRIVNEVLVPLNDRTDPRPRPTWKLPK